MSSKERRLSPRKGCAIPIRFRTFTSEYMPVEVNAAAAKRLSARMSSVRMATGESETFEGEAIDLSERGISFKSKFKFKVGEFVELFFTLPRELTGRRPEEVRCNARIVHVDRPEEGDGIAAVGAMIDRFEPLRGRSWEN
jgi:hypothetical protein